MDRKVQRRELKMEGEVKEREQGEAEGEGGREVNGRYKGEG